MENNEKLVFTRRGGVSLVDSRVCFDKFNKYLFCCVENNVRVYNVKNGEIINELKHDKSLVAVNLNPHNFLQILTCTSNGEISLWNYEEGTKLKSWKLEKSVNVHLISKKMHRLGFVVAADSEKVWSLYEIMKTENGVKLRRLAKNVSNSYKTVSCSSEGTYVAYINENLLHIKSTLQKGPISTHRMGGERIFECVQCHPFMDCIATGDSTGRVVLWYNFFDKRPVQTFYHWHNTLVSDISFSTEGSSMYTGGKECVAVKWTLQSSYKEETKEFISRLGGHIVSLSCSPDNKYLAICLDDNSIQIASTQMHIVCSIQGFVSSLWRQYGQYQDLNLPLGLKYDNLCLNINNENLTKGCLITNGRPGHLQFYDLDKDRQILNLDVVGRNIPPPEAATYSDVIHVAMLENWLATVDYRQDDHCTQDFSLKFWKFDENSNSFKLNISIDNPNMKKITSIEFCPDRSATDSGDLFLVTTSLDGNAKIWALTEIKDMQGGTKKTWLCDRMINYRHRPAYCSKFNANGRVLAVGFGHSATFWRFFDNRLLLSLSVVEENDHVTRIEFGLKPEEQKLVCILSPKSFSVWDIDAQVKLWTSNVSISSLCVDKSSGIFAAFSSKYIAYVSLSSSKPLSLYEYSQNETSILGACFVPSKISPPSNDTESLLTSSVLHFVTSDQKLMCLCTKEEAQLYQQQTYSTLDIKKPTKLSNILTTEINEKRGSADLDTRFLDQKSNLELLNAPAHTLPAIEVIGTNFLESCLQLKVKQESHSENSMEIGENQVLTIPESDTRQNLHAKNENTSLKSSHKQTKCDFSLLTSYFSKM